MMKESLWGIQYQSLKNNAASSAGTKISENVSRLLRPGNRNTHVHMEERRLFKSGQVLSNLVQWNKHLRNFFFRILNLGCTSKPTVCSAGSYSIQNLKISYSENVVVVSISYLTLILLTWRICWAPNNASRWRMGFKSAFKGLKKRANILNQTTTDYFHIPLNPSVGAFQLFHSTYIMSVENIFRINTKNIW